MFLRAVIAGIASGALTAWIAWSPFIPDPLAFHSVALAIIGAIYLGFAFSDGRLSIVIVELLVGTAFVVLAPWSLVGSGLSRRRLDSARLLGSRTSTALGNDEDPTMVPPILRRLRFRLCRSVPGSRTRSFGSRRLTWRRRDGRADLTIGRGVAIAPRPPWLAPTVRSLIPSCERSQGEVCAPV